MALEHAALPLGCEGVEGEEKAEEHDSSPCCGAVVLIVDVVAKAYV